MALLAYPLTHYSHKLLAKFIYSSEGLDAITKVSDNTFGSKIGFMVTISYFLEIFIVLLLYTVALVNTCDLILSSNFGINESNRVLISFVVVSFLMFIISMGLDIVLKIISYLI